MLNTGAHLLAPDIYGRFSCFSKKFYPDGTLKLYLVLICPKFVPDWQIYVRFPINKNYRSSPNVSGRIWATRFFSFFSENIKFQETKTIKKWSKLSILTLRYQFLIDTWLIFLHFGHILFLVFEFSDPNSATKIFFFKFRKFF